MLENMIFRLLVVPKTFTQTTNWLPQQMCVSIRAIKEPTYVAIEYRIGKQSASYLINTCRNHHISSCTMYLWMGRWRVLFVLLFSLLQFFFTFLCTQNAGNLMNKNEKCFISFVSSFFCFFLLLLLLLSKRSIYSKW